MTAAGARRVGRFHGDKGSGMVAGITLIFAFTFVGLVWLARDVDRSVANRSTANSVAFQAARSAAQAADVADLRAGRPPTIDADRARAAGIDTATALFGSYGVSGTIQIAVAGDEVTATVTITDVGRTVTGIATVEAQRAP